MAHFYEEANYRGTKNVPSDAAPSCQVMRDLIV